MSKIMAKPKILTKRLSLIAVLLVLMLALAGCSSNSSEIIDPKFGNLIVITSKGDDSAPSGDYSYLEYLAYDPETKAVYMMMTGYRRFGITPYLVSNESGGLEYAVYGQNYPIK